MSDSSYNFRLRKPDPAQVSASATHASQLPVSPDEKASMTVIELFPIRASSLPAFTAYQLEVQEETLALIGGKFAYCCNDHFPGHWFWVDHHLVTDTPLSAPTQQFAGIISSLWETQPDPYRELLAVHLDPAWCSSPAVQAEFVARSQERKGGRIERAAGRDLVGDQMPAPSASKCSFSGVLKKIPLQRFLESGIERVECPDCQALRLIVPRNGVLRYPTHDKRKTRVPQKEPRWAQGGEEWEPISGGRK